MFKKSRMKIMVLVMGILLAVLAGTLALIYFTTYREVNAQNRDMLELYAQMYASNGNPGTDPEIDPGTAPDGDPSANVTADTDADTTTDMDADLDADTTTDKDADPDADMTADTTTDTNADPDTIYETDDVQSLETLDGLGKDQAETPDDPDIPTDVGDDMLTGVNELFLDEDLSRRYMSSTFYSVSFSVDGSVLEITNDTMPMLEDEELTALAKTLMENGKTFGIQDDVIFLVTQEEDYILVSMMDNTVLGESIDTLIHYTLISGGIFIAAAFVLSYFLSNWIIKPLEISDQKQKQFISDAGHELKTPISTISANAELLSREIGENTWLSNIQYENNRMSGLVRQLLDLARLERVTPEYVSVDLSHAILSGILPFEGIAFEQGLRMDYEIEEHIHIHANEASMGELISILVDNAITHTVPGGRIYIRLKAQRNGAVPTVSNEGPEIPESERNKIFEPFYRSDTSRSNAPADTDFITGSTPASTASNTTSHYGLGLSIAKTIADTHHAKIAVACQDGFTTFEVHFDS